MLTGVTISVGICVQDLPRHDQYASWRDFHTLKVILRTLIVSTFVAVTP